MLQLDNIRRLGPMKPWSKSIGWKHRNHCNRRRLRNLKHSATEQHWKFTHRNQLLACFIKCKMPCHSRHLSLRPEIAEQKHQQAAATACAAISIQGAMECHSTGVSTKPGCLNKETEERQEHEEESNISIHLGLDTHNTSCETK